MKLIWSYKSYYISMVPSNNGLYQTVMLLHDDEHCHLTVNVHAAVQYNIYTCLLEDFQPLFSAMKYFRSVQEVSLFAPCFFFFARRYYSQGWPQNKRIVVLSDMEVRVKGYSTTIYFKMSDETKNLSTV